MRNDDRDLESNDEDIFDFYRISTTLIYILIYTVFCGSIAIYRVSICKKQKISVELNFKFEIFIPFAFSSSRICDKTSFICFVS